MNLLSFDSSSLFFICPFVYLLGCVIEQNFEQGTYIGHIYAPN
jgi:hypothetical protein